MEKYLFPCDSEADVMRVHGGPIPGNLTRVDEFKSAKMSNSTGSGSLVVMPGWKRAFEYNNDTKSKENDKWKYVCLRSKVSTLSKFPPGHKRRKYECF